MLSVLAGFPNVCGLIDGSLIPIAAPYEFPEQYIDRHGQFSLNAQFVVNHRGAVTFLSCRWPGSLHDDRALKETFLQDVLDRRILGAYYLLGDQGYRCQPNLISPYPLATTEEQIL